MSREDNLRVLRMTAIGSAVIAAAISVYFGVIVRGKVVSIGRYQLGLLVLPWAIFYGSFSPLLYHSWFGTPPHSRAEVALRYVQHVFFWLLIAAMAIVVVGIYARFVF